MPRIALPSVPLAAWGTGAARTLLSPTTARGVAVEAAWITAHVAMYPLGVVEEQLRLGTMQNVQVLLQPTEIETMPE